VSSLPLVAQSARAGRLLLGADYAAAFLWDREPWRRACRELGRRRRSRRDRWGLGCGDRHARRWTRQLDGPQD